MSVDVRPVAWLTFDDGRVSANLKGGKLPLTFEEAAVLEVHAHRRDPEAAYEAYAHATTHRADARLDLPGRSDLPAALVVLDGQVLATTVDRGLKAFMIGNAIRKADHVRDLPPRAVLCETLPNESIVDVTDQSRTSGVVAVLARRCGGPAPGALDRNTFECVVERLHSAGLLTAPVHGVRWGDFYRREPFCTEFGFTRGTPVDRYYLQQFIASNHDAIRGSTLEIGGRRSNRAAYGLERASPYTTMDVDASSGADVIADVHDPDAVRPSSVDTVLLFNVLEHCARPWVAITNVHAWLKPGGRVLALVPNAQRVHPGPRDYWRIFADGMESLFAPFALARVTSRGNLVTSMAALSGIAAEELDPRDLVVDDPRYPVVCCVVADKARR